MTDSTEASAEAGTEVDKEAALQRSHSTPEPLFGQLDFNNTGLNNHGLLPNGDTAEYLHIHGKELVVLH